MNKSFVLSKILLAVCVLPLIGLCLYCGIEIHGLAAERAELKTDYAAINNIEYGLLSVDVWKTNIEDILTDRIKDFELSDSQRTNLESEVNDILKKIILQTDSIIQSNHSLKGRLRNVVYKSFVNKDEFIKKTPVYSHEVVNEVLKSGNKEKLKNLAIEKLQEYASQTYGDTTDAYRIAPILAKYKYTDKQEFNTKSADRISYLQTETYKLTFVMLGIIVLFLLGWFIIYRYAGLQKLFFGYSIFLALVVLLTGLTSPMIEIDARISKIDFVMLGNHLQFNDQILFYQSKSILQVVQILLQTKAIDSGLVGILILVFSIIFPITKLISTQLYLLGKEKIRQNKVVYFFAIKSGKWSMADVMVVAIFMAYIGFKGILNNQLQSLNFNTPSLKSISTNLTSLQPAFILFLSFVIYGLVLSEILKIIKKKTNPPLQ